MMLKFIYPTGKTLFREMKKSTSDYQNDNISLS